MNPLRRDPTRTTTLRRKMMQSVKNRIAKIKRATRLLLIDDDAFGLVVNTRYRFLSNPQKLDAFHTWFEQLVNATLLVVDDLTGDPWTNQYVTSAYKRGVVRAYVDTKKAEGAITTESREAFLIESFDSPVSVKRLEYLHTRTFTSLRDISATMDAAMSNILARGFVDGLGPRKIAKQMTDAIESLSRKRALTLARTEIVRAYAEGQLDAFELLNVQEVGVMAEWITAGDDRVCPKCGALSNSVLKIAEARGLLPRHPNCRCAWLPANVGEKSPTQKKRKSTIQRAIKKSVQAERPKAALSDAIKRTTWPGGDLIDK